MEPVSWNPLFCSTPSCIFGRYLPGGLRQLTNGSFLHRCTNLRRFIIVPVVCAAAASSMITVVLGGLLRRVTTRPIAPFTVPFHIAVWMWLLAAQQFGNFPNDEGSIAPRLGTQTVSGGALQYDWARVMEASVIGVGQVFFFQSLWSGERPCLSPHRNPHHFPTVANRGWSPSPEAGLHVWWHSYQGCLILCPPSRRLPRSHPPQGSLCWRVFGCWRPLLSQRRSTSGRSRAPCWPVCWALQRRRSTRASGASTRASPLQRSPGSSSNCRAEACSSPSAPRRVPLSHTAQSARSSGPKDCHRSRFRRPSPAFCSACSALRSHTLAWCQSCLTWRSLRTIYGGRAIFGYHTSAGGASSNPQLAPARTPGRPWQSHRRSSSPSTDDARQPPWSDGVRCDGGLGMIGHGFRIRSRAGRAKANHSAGGG